MVSGGFAMVAAGIATLGRRGLRMQACLAVLAGLTWFAPVFTAWQKNDQGVVPSVAALLPGLPLALLFHLCLAAPDGALRRGAPRALVLGVYLETGLAALGLALVREPYLDPACWANCIDNTFLLHSLPWLTVKIEETNRWFVVLAGITLIGVCLARLVTGSRPARAALAPIAVPGIVFAGAAVMHALTLRQTITEDPFNGVLFTSFLIESSALILLAAGLIASIVRARLQRRAVARIVTDLDGAPAAGSVHSALALALRDPELRIAYPLTDGERYVDATGQPVDVPVARNGRATTRFVRDERTIAVVSHTTRVTDLEGDVGPAVLLALENERLQAELFAELEELAASRSRIVETADAERRGLERDLHDGAQQRVLALYYDIKLAKAAAESHGEVRAGSLLADAVEGAEQALEDLRTLAHGIYPAILAEAGLGPALRTLADGAPIPVDITGADDRRHPDAIETGAYFAVSELLDEAVRRGAHGATVVLAHADGRLLVTVEDDGSDPASPNLAISDRVGALWGHVTVGPHTCRVEFPCA